MKEGFAQFHWRPRPPTLLSEKQQKDIKKNLKKYYSQFESKDRMRSSKASKVRHIDWILFGYRLVKEHVCQLTHEQYCLNYTIN